MSMELQPFEQVRRLGRGINLGNALEATHEGDWGVVLKEEYFRIIREGGFDTVRLPIKWSSHASVEAPYTIDPSFLKRVDWAINQALSQQLNVVVNIHHYEELCHDPEEHTDRFLALWRQLAQHYVELPDTVYLELLNEPTGNLTADKWNTLLARAVREIRSIDPRHTLIVGGVNYNHIDALAGLVLPVEERNLIGTFHLYEPILFTHQAAEWMPPDHGTTGVVWPGPPLSPITPIAEAEASERVRSWLKAYNEQPQATNPGGPAPLLELLNTAEAWSRKHDRPLWVGEFGAIRKADLQSRSNWTVFLRSEFEKRGFTWAHWDFLADFPVMDKATNTWIEPILEALMPRKNEGERQQ
jgi:endoglucanase